MLKNTQTATQGAAAECVSVHINEAHSCFCVLHSLFHGSLFPHRDNLTLDLFSKQILLFHSSESG